MEDLNTGVGDIQGSVQGRDLSGSVASGRMEGVGRISGPRQDIDIAHYRRLLMEKKTQVEHGIKTIMENTFSEGQKWNVGESSSYDQHIAEQGLETFERGKDLGLKEGLEANQHKVNKALERMDNGTYGYCQNCKQPMILGRLEAMPDAELCVSCQERLQVTLPYRRPVEEETINTYMRGIETLTDEPYAVGSEERDKAHQGKNAKRIT